MPTNIPSTENGNLGLTWAALPMWLCHKQPDYHSNFAADFIIYAGEACSSWALVATAKPVFIMID